VRGQRAGDQKRGTQAELEDTPDLRQESIRLRRFEPEQGPGDVAAEILHVLSHRAGGIVQNAIHRLIRLRCDVPYQQRSQYPGAKYKGRKSPRVHSLMTQSIAPHLSCPQA